MDSKTQSVPLRQQLLIDQTVQGSLFRRIAFYSLACSLYFAMTLVITESLSNPHEAIAETTRRCLQEALFWAPGVMLLSPIIIYDLLKVSNRLAGPIFRLRQGIEELASGSTHEPIELRDGDYWPEVAESFNQIREELLRLRKLQARIQVPSSDEFASEALPTGADDLADPPRVDTVAEERAILPRG